MPTLQAHLHQSTLRTPLLLQHLILHMLARMKSEHIAPGQGKTSTDHGLSFIREQSVWGGDCEGYRSTQKHGAPVKVWTGGCKGLPRASPSILAPESAQGMRAEHWVPCLRVHVNEPRLLRLQLLTLLQGRARCACLPSFWKLPCVRLGAANKLHVHQVGVCLALVPA
jgi:hypothetical protein